MPLLRALSDGGARATFFIWGEHAARYPDLLRAGRACGHQIANHTYTHPHLTRLDEPTVHTEINQTQTMIRRITGVTPTLFRPPFGDTDDRVRDQAARLGL